MYFLVGRKSFHVFIFEINVYVRIQVINYKIQNCLNLSDYPIYFPLCYTIRSLLIQIPFKMQNTLRKKIYLLHLERIVKCFLNLLTRNIDFQGIRIR